ncbi:phosphatase PAP2 family protein [Streptomyces sp. NPDC058985]|uniref:phosphatase PAP2 family protein n=1 Tax=Streptomyces sp. NPDC058985 TaxID=3346684 RepID=UPI00368FCD1C
MQETMRVSGAQVYDGSGVDGTAYLEVVDMAHRAPAWFDRAVSDYSSYGLTLFAALMLVGWWRARRQGAPQAIKALAVPVLTVVAFGLSTLVKQTVHENRPCRSLHVVTIEACPAPDDWSFPSNHATLAAAAAVALWFVSVRLGAIAAVGALAMAGSRVWVGAHYPHDVLAGIAVGTALTVAAALLLQRCASALAGVVGRSRLRVLITS